MQGLKDRDLFRQAGLIGGAWKAAASGKAVDVIDPATQAVIGSVPDMGGGKPGRRSSPPMRPSAPGEKRPMPSGRPFSKNGSP